MPVLNVITDDFGWLKWYKEWNNLVTDKQWNDKPQFWIPNVRLLFRGTALTIFTSALSSVENINEQDIKTAVEKVSRAFLSEHPRENLFNRITKPKKYNISLKEHVAKFIELVSLIPYLPENENEVLSEVDTIRIFKQTLPDSWLNIYRMNNQTIEN